MKDDLEGFYEILSIALTLKHLIRIKSILVYRQILKSK